jgi:hypothetical protein
MIGDSDFHGDTKMGKGCGSPANDRLIPTCWHAYRHYKKELFEWAGLASSNNDKDDSRRFATWLSAIRKKSDGGFGCKTTNAAHTFMWYFKEENNLTKKTRPSDVMTPSSSSSSSSSS